jgi:hypothetical protein
MAIAVRPKRFSFSFASSLVDEHMICKGSIRFGGYLFVADVVEEGMCVGV